MTKKELVKLIEFFDDEIEIFVLDCNNMPLSIKHVAYVPMSADESASLEIIPMGSHTDMKNWLG